MFSLLKRTPSARFERNSGVLWLLLYGSTTTNIIQHHETPPSSCRFFATTTKQMCAAATAKAAAASAAAEVSDRAHCVSICVCGFDHVDRDRRVALR